MMDYAKPVFWADNSDAYNRFAAFRCDIDVEPFTALHIKITARSFYRLFVDGEMYAHGPARAGHGTLRVDELVVTSTTGSTKLAVELAAYSTTDNYSNNITCEAGLLMVEVWDGETLLSATGHENLAPWLCCELHERKSNTDLISHCREIIEVYNLNPQYNEWLTGQTNGWDVPAILDVQPKLLPRRASMPEMVLRPGGKLLQATDVVKRESATPSNDFNIVRFFRSTWYDQLENSVSDEMALYEEHAFSGQIAPVGTDEYRVEHTNKTAMMWDMKSLAVGFVVMQIRTEQEMILEMLHGDALDAHGTLSNTKVPVRYMLKPGEYRLVTFEPYLVRYIKLVFSGEGVFQVKPPQILTYWCPTPTGGNFLCSDVQINSIYEAAALTLQANTLDIFMDCPERERGGWLCDSFWTARAANMMMGHSKVEKDFLENFLMIPADKCEPYGFFFDVYPGNQRDCASKAGITTWSFWLALELCEYYARSADEEFISTYRVRVEQFVDGACRFLGKEGLLENIPGVFIDWSQSNLPSNTGPISVPANALFAVTLCELARLYDRDDWHKLGEAIRARLLGVAVSHGILGWSVADALEPQSDGLAAKPFITEGAIFTDVWAGLLDRRTHPDLTEQIVASMGTHPTGDRNMYIGQADLFIGLIIRHDMLAKLGEYEVLLNELRALYLPQIAAGPGTLYEAIGANKSLCHGMNSHAGYLLTRDILGLGEPRMTDKTIRVAPHPCGLAWAQGTVLCDNGVASVSWQADYSARKFILRISVPKGWTADVSLPDLLQGWETETQMC